MHILHTYIHALRFIHLPLDCCLYQFIAMLTHQKWRKFILCLNKDGLCLYLFFISVELGRYRCIRNLLQ